MLRFTLRDLFWLILLAAVAFGWWRYAVDYENQLRSRYYLVRHHQTLEEHLDERERERRTALTTWHNDHTQLLEMQNSIQHLEEKLALLREPTDAFNFMRAERIQETEAYIAGLNQLLT